MYTCDNIVYFFLLFFGGGGGPGGGIKLPCIAINGNVKCRCRSDSLLEHLLKESK